MYKIPSRSEARTHRIYTAAKEGKFEIDITLYPSEIKSLQKQGFYVTTGEPITLNSPLSLANVSWQKPFGSAIPHVVFSYIHGILTTCPNCIDNFAKEVYVVSQKANLK